MGEGFRGESPSSVKSPWDSEPSGGRRSLGCASPAHKGRFQVLGLLGPGEFATTYRAVDPDSGRRLALTIPRPPRDSSEDPEAREQFLIEGEALARLRHPRIVPILEAGDDGRPYWVTPLTDGTPLVALLQEGPLPPERAATIALGVAEALAHAHAMGIVHRAVSPSTVLLGAEGEALLNDFGLGRFAWAGGGSALANWQASPAYVPPERAEGRSAMDLFRADQYGLGVLLYEMLCGRPPFIGSPEVVFFASWNDDPLPPNAFRSGLPQGLERICLKAMARRPEDRYPNCVALGKDLQDWRASRHRRRGRAGRVRRAGHWVRRRPAETVSAALAVLALAATSVYATARFSTQPVDRGQVRAPAALASQTAERH